MVTLILERLPVTLELTAFAVAFALVLGIPAGILSATRRDQRHRQRHPGGDAARPVRPGVLAGHDADPVLLALPALDAAGGVGGLLHRPGRNLTIMVLPALCLGTASAANIARTTRACMLDVLRSEYIRTAAAKGLAGRVVVLKHALRNALIPIVTVAGLQIGILLGGTVVVEEVFTLPGVGRLVLWSIYQRDYPLTQSTILFIAVLFMTINLAVDLLYGYLDPRIRYSTLSGHAPRRPHARLGAVRAGQAASGRGGGARGAAGRRGARAHGGERRLSLLPARRRRLLEGRAGADRAGRRGRRRGGAVGPGVATSWSAIT